MKNRRKTGILTAAMIVATFAFASFAQSASASTMRSLLSDKCLEVAPNEGGFYVPNNLLIFQQTCTGTNQQQWDLEARGNAPIRGRQGVWSVFRFHNRRTNSCLDNRDGSLTNGTPVQVFTCNNSSTELWTISRSGAGGSAELVNARSGLCLDIHGGFLGNGVRAEQFQCAPTRPFEGNLFFF